jgi:hypothetical protein
MPLELSATITLLAQVLVLTAANYLLILYLTDTTVDGPFHLFERIRKLAGIEKVAVYNIGTEETEDSIVVRDRFWARVLDCHRCSSPYGALLLVLLSWLTGFSAVSWTAVILWLAVAGTTVLTFELIER